jgi:hypothetical protein
MRISTITAVGLFLVGLPLSGGVGSTAIAQAQTTWGSIADMHRGKNGQRFQYACPPGGSPGTIFGTNIYTDDSSVCTAAVHAGLISFAAGGTVTIEIGAGQMSYAASTRNGVTSNAYSRWHGSFAFGSFGPPPQANRPPNPPTLTGPPNTYAPAVSPYDVTLRWQNNGDPDGDPVSFEIQVYLWDTTTGQWKYISRYSGNGTSLLVPSGSAPNAYYAWRVFAIDPNKRSNPWYAASSWSVYYTYPVTR